MLQWNRGRDLIVFDRVHFSSFMIKRIWVVGFRGSGKTELLRACSVDGHVPDQVHWWPLSVTTRDGSFMTEVGDEGSLFSRELGPVRIVSTHA